MAFHDITQVEKEAYNELVTHPLQSFEWGEFRKKTGIKVIRKGLYKQDKLVEGFTLTIHKIPHTNWTIGYLPKGKFPSKDVLKMLWEIGKEQHCIFIQLEPNVVRNIYNSKTNEIIKNEMTEDLFSNENIVKSAHPLFTKYTFLFDLTKSDEELLAQMHPKTRYNIKVARKHNVIVDIESDDFETYWRLTEETTKRQKFYAHSKDYHKNMWDTLHIDKSSNLNYAQNNLTAHLLIAKYKAENREEMVDLVSWILFTFHDKVYYPYGASSTLYKNVMAPNLIMWEAIQFGKKLGLKTLDMWGSMGPNPDTKDPWYGFHRFKLGYNPTLVEFIGSYDFVIEQNRYKLYKLANNARWMILNLRK